MRLTPLDIRKQEFRKGMRGLDADEVYAFLSTVADEYEAVINDNKALRERLLELDDKVQEYRNMEKTLRDTLLTAERVTVEAKENARRESDLIVKEAQIEAEKALRDIRTASMRLRQEIQELRQQRDSYLSRMRILVESHVKFIETAEKDFAQEERQLAAAQQRAEAETQQPSVTAPASRPTANQPNPQPEIQPESEPDLRAEAPREPKPEASAGKVSEMLDRVIEQQKDALAAEADTTPRGRISEPVAPRAPAAAPAPATVFQAAATAEAPVAAVPETPPAAVDREPRPEYQNEPDFDDGGAETQTTAAPASSAAGPGEWSLEKLKRDILGGSKPENEKD